ncbi:MAG: DUF1214 domain-containing protein [Abitibacteriaceae bacterium]|nr:DUF1214 domain-containing protein [Abditibacteriaceae bacterium]
MMKPLCAYGSALLVSLILGLASAWWAIAAGGAGAIQNGAWRYNPRVGSNAAGLYARAQTAHAGPLALNQSEALYLLATTDDAGNVLRCEHKYRLIGHNFQARWWSITAYDADGFLIANSRQRYSYSSASLAHDPTGEFVIHLSRQPQPGNWLPTGDGQTFFLALRLYNPDAALREHLATWPLPHIVEDGPHG